MTITRHDLQGCIDYFENAGILAWHLIPIVGEDRAMLFIEALRVFHGQLLTTTAQDPPDDTTRH